MSNGRLKTTLCMQIENLTNVLIKGNFDEGERLLKYIEAIFTYELLDDSTTVTPKEVSALTILGNKD